MFHMAEFRQELPIEKRDGESYIHVKSGELGGGCFRL